MIFKWSMFYYAPRAVIRKLWRICSGQNLFVAEDEKLGRLGICESCKQYTGFQCKVCGCNIKLKIQFVDETCPERKW